MDEKKRIEEIKEGLKKSVYLEASRINVEENENDESTEKLSNILEGYMERIDTIEAQNMEELEEELRVLKRENVEVGSIEERDQLVKQYNDYIHNDLERTIAETIEYTQNLDNHTDDLNDILIRPMADEDLDEVMEVQTEEEPETVQKQTEEGPAVDTDELFEIEATTDLGVFEDIVELEEDTLDIEGTTVASSAEIEDIDHEDLVIEEKTREKRSARAKRESKPKKAKKVEQPKRTFDEDDDFSDEKGIGTLDYVLIVVLIVIFAILIGLVAKINGVF